MTPTFALPAPTVLAAPVRTSRPARATWPAALVEAAKAWIARAIVLPDVLPGKDGWYL